MLDDNAVTLRNKLQQQIKDDGARLAEIRGHL